MVTRFYIGPSKPYGTLLMTNTIIQDIAGVHGLAEAIEKHPDLEELLVPIPQLFVKRNEIAQKGSRLFKIAEKVKAETKTLGGE